MSPLVIALISLGGTALLGILAWFLKRLVSGLEIKIEESQRQNRESIERFERRIEDQNRQFRELAESVEKRFCSIEERVNQTIKELPFVYTLRDDFIRAQATTDRKLDRILEILHDQGRS